MARTPSHLRTRSGKFKIRKKKSWQLKKYIIINYYKYVILPSSAFKSIEFLCLQCDIDFPFESKYRIHLQSSRHLQYVGALEQNISPEKDSVGSESVPEVTPDERILDYQISESLSLVSISECLYN